MLSINLIKHEQQQRVKQALTTRAKSSTEEQTGKTWCDMRILVTVMYEYILTNDYGLNLLNDKLKDIYHLINLMIF